MEATEKYERNGLTVAIHQDEQPMSPAEWDNLGTLYLDTGRDRYDFAHEIDSAHTVAAWVWAHRIAGHAIVPLRFHDYGSSGLDIRESYNDADANGFIVAMPDDAALLGVPSGDEEWQLRNELAEWNQYLSGDVYGYTITTPEGHVLDSLWGMYGFEYAKEEADSAADGYTADEVRALDLADLTAQRDALNERIAALGEVAA
jgi:hypothetical protein